MVSGDLAWHVTIKDSAYHGASQVNVTWQNYKVYINVNKYVYRFLLPTILADLMCLIHLIWDTAEVEISETSFPIIGGERSRCHRRHITRASSRSSSPFDHQVRGSKTCYCYCYVGAVTAETFIDVVPFSFFLFWCVKHFPSVSNDSTFFVTVELINHDFFLNHGIFHTVLTLF